MSDISKLIQQYYDSWKTGKFNPDLLTRDVTFHGPLMQSVGIDAFLTMFDKMRNIVEVEAVELESVFFNSKNHEACILFDVITSKPIEATTHCTEHFKIEDGKIKSIRLVYDAREWEGAGGSGM